MEILPFLYLGSAYHAARRDMLDALGITALLNVSSDCPNHFEGHYQYKCIPVEDNHKADISSWFMEAIEYIGECLHRGCVLLELVVGFLLQRNGAFGWEGTGVQALAASVGDQSLPACSVRGLALRLLVS